MSLCVCVCVCVSVPVLQALPRGGNESEWALPPPRCLRGPASVSVMHSPLVQTPLPSVLLLCHCRQPSKHPAHTHTHTHTHAHTHTHTKAHGQQLQTQARWPHTHDTGCCDYNEATHGHKTNTWDRRLMKITLSLQPVYLCDSPSLIQSLTHSHTHTHTHTHTQHTPTHITLTRAHRRPSPSPCFHSPSP